MSHFIIKDGEKSVLLKSGDALRTIGETAKLIDVPQHVLRFWESKFPQIEPIKRRGRRYYRPSDIEILFIIKKLLYQEGYTIKGVQRYIIDLKENGEMLLSSDLTSIIIPRTETRVTTTSQLDVETLKSILHNLEKLQHTIKKLIKNSD